MSNTDAICKRCGGGYWRPVCDALDDTGYCTDACQIADLKAQVAEKDRVIEVLWDHVSEIMMGSAIAIVDKIYAEAKAKECR